ncbi:MAG: hypothetical protein NBKEAIPA_00280 [Nitrospirae bacterium]|nr:hypothetical protein [Nitrospirota bacterium]MCE7963929.1 hypothetical protein [Nitrospira sp. NTP2]MCK6501567.1 hypothetical protein [Nitrospira sp.]MEB2339663.1 hypothetical protein [Nitrospirales bacterium]QOJ35610.1 MAG: hypothetical protein HRU82_11960 [Nitrospira sp.]
MNRNISEVDGEAKARAWLGGEAAVPRYPQRGGAPFVFKRSLLGLVALAVGLGFAGGLLTGLQCRCRAGSDRSDR